MKYNSFLDLKQRMGEIPDPEDFEDEEEFLLCDDIDEEPDYDHDKEEMIEERGIEADNNRM